FRTLRGVNAAATGHSGSTILNIARAFNIVTRGHSSASTAGPARKLNRARRSAGAPSKGARSSDGAAPAHSPAAKADAVRGLVARGERALRRSAAAVGPPSEGARPAHSRAWAAAATPGASAAGASRVGRVSERAEAVGVGRLEAEAAREAEGAAVRE